MSAIVSDMSLTDIIYDTVRPDGRASAGRLLGVLIELDGHAVSVAEAARDANLSKATAARAVDRLVASGLVTEHRLPRERMISVNRSSPFYDPIADLLWVEAGVVRPHQHDSTTHISPFDIHDFQVQKLVPRSLQTLHDTFDHETYDGPELTHVRALVLRLEKTCWTDFERWLQRTYGQWNDERDRDLIHLTLHLGNGLWHAVSALRRSTDKYAIISSSSTNIGQRVWAHATYALNAEATMCLNVSDFLREATNRGHTYHRIQQLVDEERIALDQNLRKSTENEGSTDFESDYKAQRSNLADREDELRKATEALDGFYGHGGTPPKDSVGRAGERLMVVQTRSAAATWSKFAHVMATHSSFRSWADANPDVLRDHPLLPPVSPELWG